MENLNRKLYFNLRMLNRKLHHGKRQTFRGQNRVLAILLENDGLIQSELVSHLDIRPSSLTELLKKMEEKGDIYRREDEADKRLRYVHLSEVGKAKALELKDDDSSIFDVLSDSEKEELYQLLDKLTADFKAEHKKRKAEWAALDDDEKMVKRKKMRSFRHSRRTHR